MAKKCMIAREKRRILAAHRARTRRLELKKMISDPNLDYSEKNAAVEKLSCKPRNESPCRTQRRCTSCGRPRGVYRKFALCRICLRQAAMRGDVPGLVKASW